MEHSDLPRRNSRRSILIGILAFAAGALLTAIPAVILYLFLQRYIVSGLTAGAVKG